MKLSVVIAILLVVIAVCRGEDFWKDPGTREKEDVDVWFKEFEKKINEGGQGFETDLRTRFFSKTAIVARSGEAMVTSDAIENWLSTSFGPASSQWTEFENTRVFGSGGPYAVLAEMKVYEYNAKGANPNGQPINHYMLTVFVSPFRGTLRVTEWSEMPDPDFGYGSTQVEDVIFGNELKARDITIEGAAYVEIPEPSNTIDTAGRVTKVQFYAQEAGRVFLQVWRPQGDLTYTLVGEIELVSDTVGQIITVDVPAADVISVNVGDVVGFRWIDGYNPIPGDIVEVAGSDGHVYDLPETTPTVGSTITFSQCECDFHFIYSFKITISG